MGGGHICVAAWRGRGRGNAGPWHGHNGTARMGVAYVCPVPSHVSYLTMPQPISPIPPHAAPLKAPPHLAGPSPVPTETLRDALDRKAPL